MEMTAQCGLQMLEDGVIAECVSHKCLLCGKIFFMASKMIHHLHTEHNFLQFQTYMCYHRLASRCMDPCQFCCLRQHAEQCPALLNLAVFLLNGRGIRGLGRHRYGYKDLGQFVDKGTDGKLGHCAPSSARRQTAANGSKGKIQLWLHNQSADGGTGHTLQTGPTTRGHASESPTGESVSATVGTR